MTVEHTAADATVGNATRDTSRLGGDQWWEPDRARHLQDRPRYCPNCAFAIGDDEDSLSVEYWEADRRVYRARCASCGWTGDIVRVHRAVSHEPD